MTERMEDAYGPLPRAIDAMPSVEYRQCVVAMILGWPFVFAMGAVFGRWIGWMR